MSTPLTAATELLDAPTFRVARAFAEGPSPPASLPLAVAEPFALIVEPDVEIATTVARLLVTHGLAPVVVGDGLAALAALAARGTPGLTIINPSLDGVDGFAVLRVLRERASVTAAPAVAMTASAALRIRAIELNSELGICAVLAPTLPLARLADVLGDVLVRARAAQALAPVRSSPPVPMAPSARCPTVSARRPTVSARRLEARITEQVRLEVVEDAAERGRRRCEVEESAPTARGIDRSEGWREFVLRMG